MAGPTPSMVAANIWTARVIPVILSGMIVYATYVVVGPLSVDYLLKEHRNIGAVIPILITYFILLILTIASFGRLVHLTIVDPPYVPLGPAAIRDKELKKRSKRSSAGRGQGDGIGSKEYTSDGQDVEPPGLEMFYTKDIFVAEMDGKPKWCTHCANWKPDRAHHCSSAARCIKKMDHFCPWVGGPIGENNFKFFIQFTGYCALYCSQVMIVMAIYVQRQRAARDESLNPHFVVVLGLSALFSLFTLGMTATSVELAIRNQTQVERLGAETRIHILAVIKPERAAVVNSSQAAIPCPEITYPLGSGPQPSLNHNVSKPAEQGPTQQQPDFDLVQSVVSNGVANRPSADQPQWPTKEIAERDLKATRTFNVLKMPEHGYNPWDLGSSLLNWETVMGYSWIDWALPLRRSPCTFHEETESYYEVGPMVDLLRSKYGLIPESEIRVYGGRRRNELQGVQTSSNSRVSSSHGEQHERHRKRRRRKSHRDEISGSTIVDQPIELHNTTPRN